MGNNIEWGEIANVDATLYDPGSFSDPFGNQNDDLAIAFGDGIVVEGTLDEWDKFHERLAASIGAERAAEKERNEEGDDEEDTPGIQLGKHLLANAKAQIAAVTQVSVDGVVVAETTRIDLTSSEDNQLPERKGYAIKSMYIDVEDAHVFRLTYAGGATALVMETEDGVGPAEREALSTNMGAYGMTPEDGEVFIKDWAEHEGLADALVVAGIATKVGDPIYVGPFNSKAQLMRISEEIR